MMSLLTRLPVILEHSLRPQPHVSLFNLRLLDARQSNPASGKHNEARPANGRELNAGLSRECQMWRFHWAVEIKHCKWEIPVSYLTSSELPVGTRWIWRKWWFTHPQSAETFRTIGEALKTAVQLAFSVILSYSYFSARLFQQNHLLRRRSSGKSKP